MKFLKILLIALILQSCSSDSKYYYVKIEVIYQIDASKEIIEIPSSYAWNGFHSYMNEGDVIINGKTIASGVRRYRILEKQRLNKK